MVAKSLKRWAGPFAEFGFALGLLYVLDRALRTLGSAWGIFPYEFFLQPVALKPLLAPALAKNLQAELLVPAHPLLNSVLAPQAVVQDRLQRGAHCVAALRKAELLGYAWWCSHEYAEQEVGCVFELPAGAPAVFDFDVHVPPAHRMGLGFMAVWHVFMEQLRSAGTTHSYSRISRFNLASRRAHMRMGAAPIGRVVFVRAGSLNLAFFPRFPFLQAAFGPGCRLRLHLGAHGVQW